MEIRAGDQVIKGATIYAERIWYMDASRPALRIALEGALTEAQLAALKSGEWELYDGDALAGKYSGYSASVRHELILAKVQPAEIEVAQAQADKSAAQAEANRLSSALSGDIASLKSDSAQLDGRMEAATQNAEFMENCIIEMAGVVYA